MLVINMISLVIPLTEGQCQPQFLEVTAVLDV